jgi:hypothetical protein
MSLMLVLALASAPVPAKPDDAAWLQCASVAVQRRLDKGVPAKWPKADGLPAGLMMSAELASRPSEDASDALHYVLHGVPERNLVYIARSGGIGDFRVVYGPLRLGKHCARARQAG